MCGPTETGLRARSAHGSLGVNLWSRLMTDRIAQMGKPRPREAKGLGWGREQSTSETRVGLLRVPHGAAFRTFPALVPGGSTLPATQNPGLVRPPCFLGLWPDCSLCPTGPCRLRLSVIDASGSQHLLLWFLTSESLFVVAGLGFLRGRTLGSHPRVPTA